jgi:hypothetical protein
MGGAQHGASAPRPMAVLGHTRLSRYVGSMSPKVEMAGPIALVFLHSLQTDIHRVIWLSQSAFRASYAAHQMLGTLPYLTA